MDDLHTGAGRNCAAYAIVVILTKIQFILMLSALHVIKLKYDLINPLKVLLYTRRGSKGGGLMGGKYPPSLSPHSEV